MASLKNTTINDTGHLTIPSGTLLQRPATPSAGMFRYNSEYKLNEFYNGTEWTTSTGENSIVQNGLVLWLDAGLSSSYPGSGTTWNDLSGNGYNFTINASAYSTSGGTPHMNFEGSFGAAKRLVNGSMSNVPNAANGTIMVFSTILNSTGNWRTMLRGASSDHQVIIQSGANDLGMYDNTTNGFLDSTFDIISLPNPYTNFNCLTFKLSQSSPQYQFQYNNDPTVYSITNANATFNNGFSVIGAYHNESNDVNNNSQYWGKIAVFLYYNRHLSNAEILQNYFSFRNRYSTVTNFKYETLTYTTSANLTVTGNGTNSVNIFKTSGSNAWDNHAYTTTAFTAPCTIEFNKQAGATDNGVSYAMIGWNVDPTTNASYDTIDYASYPYATNNYQVYHNSSLVQNGGTWSTSSKFYVVYGTDGFIRHYNGSTLLYSVNYGTGKTVYVDSSFYSVNATFGGFSNIRVCRSAWNGTQYV